MRLIDADALINLMDSRFKEVKKVVCDNLAEGFVQMQKLIKEQPTVEAKPVVHGEWNGNTCSACGINWDENMVNNADDWGYFEPMPNFCPNCGAKMIRR